MDREKMEYYGLLSIGGVLFGVLVYFTMMSLDLVNSYDGIWHWSNFVAGDWEISLGRGLQRYFDKLRFGIVATSLNTILTLILTVAATVLVLETMNINNKMVGGLMIALVVAHPTICSSLSYSYMSVNFGLAFFFSAASAFVLICLISRKKYLSGMLLGGLCLAVSMASYQAYLGVSCVLLLMVFAQMLMENQEIKVIKKYVVSGIGMILTGGAFYWCITQLLLLRAGIALSSYKGAANISIKGIVMNLPRSISECYRQFWAFFTVGKMYNNLPFMEYLLLGCGVLCIISVIYQFIKILKRNKLYAFGYLLAVLLTPVAANAVLLVAVGNSVTSLMAMGMLLSVGLIYVHIPKEDKMGKYITWIYCFVMLLAVWFGTSTVSNDQLALKEGKVATITLAQNIMDEIIDGGFYDQSKAIALIGRPAENDMFPHNYAYETANEYARFGSWSTEAGNNRRSWSGVFSNFVGMNIHFVDEATYNELRVLPEIEQMPEFPASGSIKEIEGVIVVKVSELY